VLVEREGAAQFHRAVTQIASGWQSILGFFNTGAAFTLLKTTSFTHSNAFVAGSNSTQNGNEVAQ
jgi:hypothetical protein